MHKLGLLPFVKKAQFNEGRISTSWILSALFGSSSTRYFHALINLQDLAIASLDLVMFPSVVGAFFGHFAPTLRSLALITPVGNRRQLLDFFRLFPKLDDITICGYYGEGENQEALDGKLVPIRGGLRGQLKLKNFHDRGLLKDLIVAFGGMRFTSMRLESVRGVSLLLKACADTLRTVYIHPGDRFHPGEGVTEVHIPDARTDVTLSVTPSRFDFSRNAVIQTLEIPLHSAHIHARTISALSTIISPAFSELVIIFSGAGCWQKLLADVLVDMYKIKQFRVKFCLEASEESMAQSLERLAADTWKATAQGIYDFLPFPPVVCSRPLSSFDCFCQSSPVVA